MSALKIVSQKTKFKLTAACPYCGADLTYIVTDWEKDGKLWKAQHVESSCDNEPDIENRKEWNDFIGQHSDMPYIHQMPVDEMALKKINDNYRFSIE